MARKYKAATAKEVQAYNLGRIAYHDGVAELLSSIDMVSGGGDW